MGVPHIPLQKFEGVPEGRGSLYHIVFQLIIIWIYFGKNFHINYPVQLDAVSVFVKHWF